MTPLKANPDIVFKREGDEGVLFDPETGTLRFLNETGAFVFSHLGEVADRSTIVDRMLDAFDIPSREDAERDLDAFLDEMREAGIVN